MRIDISDSLFRELILYAVDHDDDPTMAALSKVLQDKLRRMVDRDLYGQYRAAKTDAERNAARQAYLDARGIPDSYRW